MERNIKLVISYDGTDFCGWQVQNNGRTVQGDIESALEKIHGRHIRLTGSGRTDSGVHANGQVANFYTDNRMPAGKFVPALNSLIPGDVRIMHSQEVDADFHSRFDARIRIYRYYIKTGGICEPQYRNYCWRIRRQPDPAILNRIAAPLVGTHDFTSFAAAGDPSDSKIRHLYSAAFTPEGRFLVFKIAGNAFLWKMVRSIVGTAVRIEEEGGGAETMERILTSCDRDSSGPTAPPQGLFLDKVLYDEQSAI